MNSRQSPRQILENEVLPLRAKLLEVAAMLDRIERGTGPAADGELLHTIRLAIETLLRNDSNRAEQIQLLFSRPYADEWRDQMEV